MSRRPDHSRKPELLSQILDFLIDKPLAKLSFRTLASALGVSTFTLVYQFGSRSQMITEIVKEITSRQKVIEEKLESNRGGIDAYYENLEFSWDWTLEPRNRQLQRLEFEAALLGVLDEELTEFSRGLFKTWIRVGKEALEAYGLSPEVAETEARIVVNAFYGMQYDLLVNDQTALSTGSLNRFLAEHRGRIERMVSARDESA